MKEAVTKSKFDIEVKKLIESTTKGKWVFRGLKCSKYSCTTSFARLIHSLESEIRKRWSDNEIRELTRWHNQYVQEVKKELGDFDDKYVWYFVQHLKNVTNLLDVTVDPQIAFQFASAEHTEKDHLNCIC